ncbi:MAG: TIGR00341 family protein [Candidatus Bathyarchaeota archaeon]|nr:TIGR00341 family protein [Candidatus Bathyarchaeota archaeon]
MKKIEVIVTPKEAPDGEKALKHMGLLYVHSKVLVEDEECSSYSALIPDEFAAKAMDKVSSVIDLRHKNNMVSMLVVEGVTSSFIERLKEKASKAKSALNPTEELVESTQRYTHLTWDLLATTLLATLIALSGLFLDNVIIIIGGMLIPPLLGPVNALAVNANLGHPKKLLNSQAIVLMLLAAVILLSALTTFIASQFISLPTTQQILIQVHVSIFDVLIALVIGIAAGLALRTELPENLFGVVISVALVPPATVAGIELALANEIFFVSALVLTLVYLLGLEFGCTLMLRLLGVSPSKYYQKGEAKRRSTYSIIMLAVLFVLLALIVYFLPFTA